MRDDRVRDVEISAVVTAKINKKKSSPRKISSRTFYELMTKKNFHFQIQHENSLVLLFEIFLNFPCEISAKKSLEKLILKLYMNIF